MANNDRCVKSMLVVTIVLVGAMWGAQNALAAGDALPPADQPQFRHPVWAPDVYGGYASDYIIVQLPPLGGEPAAAAFARGSVEQRLDSPAFSTLRAEWGVLHMRRLYPFEFGNKQRAADLGLDRMYRLDVPVGTDTPAMANAFAALTDDVISAQVDGIGGVALIPNDSSFGLLYGMHNTGQTGGTPDADIDAPEAWDLHTGDVGTVTVAVVDSGVSSHIEFADRMVPGTNTNQPGGPTSDGCPHGTHVAGTVGPWQDRLVLSSRAPIPNPGPRVCRGIGTRMVSSSLCRTCS